MCSTQYQYLNFLCSHSELLTTWMFMSVSMLSPRNLENAAVAIERYYYPHHRCEGATRLAFLRLLLNPTRLPAYRIPHSPLPVHLSLPAEALPVLDSRMRSRCQLRTNPGFRSNSEVSWQVKLSPIRRDIWSAHHPLFTPLESDFNAEQLVKPAGGT